MNDNHSGVWLDTDTNKVVRSEPENGRLLASPGVEISPEIQARIDLFAADAIENAAPEVGPNAPKPKRVRK